MPTWPRDDAEHELFTDWQFEVGNGNTLMGFRDWIAHVTREDAA